MKYLLNNKVQKLFYTNKKKFTQAYRPQNKKNIPYTNCNIITTLCKIKNLYDDYLICNILNKY